MRSLLFIFLCLFVLSIVQGKVSYHGFKMYEVIPKNGIHLKVLQGMYPESRRDNIDFWVPPRGINIPVQISVPPNSNLAAKFRLIGMDTRLVMDNVQHYIDQQSNKPLKFTPKVKMADFDYTMYHTLEDIYTWITDITTQYSTIAKKEIIGTSYDGRDIYVIEINTGVNPDKKAFFIEGGIHAREWISPATVMYMTWQMLEQYGNDADITKMVDGYTWYIVPVFNVDGYAFTWTDDRLWRKTRSPQGNCIGVDPNRNWNSHFCEEGASNNPCTDTYCGPSPFSEVEVKAVSDFIKAREGDIVAFIDYHSFSQLWMTPWGYTSQLPPDYTELLQRAEAATEALRAVSGTFYQSGNIADIIYVASGSSVDWTYDEAGVKNSYAVELRDTGEFGFLLPADQIVPSGDETLAAMKTLSLDILGRKK